MSLGVLLGCTSCMDDDSCVAEGGLVSTPEGWRAVESLDVGDVIWAVDPATGVRVETTITAIRSATRECLALRFGADELECTPTHPIYCPAEAAYVQAVAFVNGQARQILRVDDEGAQTQRVRAVRSDVGTRRVFDLSVDSEHHNFVVNGALVHNKSESGGLPSASSSSTGTATDEAPTSGTTSSSGASSDTGDDTATDGTAGSSGAADSSGTAGSGETGSSSGG